MAKKSAAKKNDHFDKIAIGKTPFTDFGVLVFS